MALATRSSAAKKAADTRRVLDARKPCRYCDRNPRLPRKSWCEACDKIRNRKADRRKRKNRARRAAEKLIINAGLANPDLTPAPLSSAVPVADASGIVPLRAPPPIPEGRVRSRRSNTKVAIVTNKTGT